MRLIILNEDNIVVSIREGKTINKNEFESNVGEIGQKMLEDGTFVDVPVEPVEPKPTIEERILVETQYQTILLEMYSMF